MVLCKLNFAWTIKKSAKQPIFAQKQPIFGLQKSRYSIKSGERKAMALGEKLTQARKAVGLTQADVAARLNVSRQAVSRWESGQSKPSTERLLALGELYGVSIDQLLNTGNVELPAVDTVPTPPEVEPREPVIPEKRRTRAWLKYAIAALCGALLMLVVLLIPKKPDSSEKSVDVKRFTDLEVDHVGDIRRQGEGFDFTWD